MILTPIQIAKALHAIHHHADDVCAENPEQIVYKESELIKFLQSLGYPAPDWAGYAQQMEDFVQQVVTDNLIGHPRDTIFGCMEHANMKVEELLDKLYYAEEVEERNNFLSVLQGKKRVTNDIAERLGKIFKIDKQYWINRQHLYEEKVVKAAAARRGNPFKLS